jgi:uncharacterized coiled-coil protein SlyX
MSGIVSQEFDHLFYEFTELFKYRDKYIITLDNVYRWLNIEYTQETIKDVLYYVLDNNNYFIKHIHYIVKNNNVCFSIEGFKLLAISVIKCPRAKQLAEYFDDCHRVYEAHITGDDYKKWAVALTELEIKIALLEIGIVRVQTRFTDADKKIEKSKKEIEMLVKENEELRKAAKKRKR